MTEKGSSFWDRLREASGRQEGRSSKGDASTGFVSYGEQSSRPRRAPPKNQPEPRREIDPAHLERQRRAAIAVANEAERQAAADRKLAAERRGKKSSELATTSRHGDLKTQSNSVLQPPAETPVKVAPKETRPPLVKSYEFRPDSTLAPHREQFHAPPMSIVDEGPDSPVTRWHWRHWRIWIHVVLGIVFWPLLFVLFEENLRRGSCPRCGERFDFSKSEVFTCRKCSRFLWMDGHYLRLLRWGFIAKRPAFHWDLKYLRPHSQLRWPRPDRCCVCGQPANGTAERIKVGSPWWQATEVLVPHCSAHSRGIRVANRGPGDGTVRFKSVDYAAEFGQLNRRDLHSD